MVFRPAPVALAISLALGTVPAAAASTGATAPPSAVVQPDAAPVQDKHSSDKHSVTELSQVVVHAVPGGEALDSLVQPVAVLSGAQLDDNRASTLGATVSTIPGVQSTALGQAVGRPVIHGMGGPRVDVTEGGLSAADVSTISQDHAVTIEPFLADQIEVLKGPSTLLYGSGAIGGVVNVETGRIPTHAPADGFSGRAAARHDGVSDGNTGMLRMDAGNERYALHVDGMRRRADDYRIPGGSLANSYLRTSAGGVGGSLLGDWGFLGASYSRYLNTYGSPAEPGDPSAGEPPVHIKLAQTRYDLKGGFDTPFDGIHKIQLSAGHTDYQHVEFEGAEAATTFTNRSDQARLMVTHEPLGGWKGTLGLQYLNRHFAAIGEETFVPPTATRNLGLFLTEQHAWGPWKLNLGGRVDRHTSTPAGGPKHSLTPKSFSAGLGWEVTDAWRLTLNLDRSQRAPAEEESFAHGPHEASGSFEIGNPELTVETANQVELGLHYRAHRIDAKVSAYGNRFDNFIYLADTGAVEDGLPVRLWSQSDARFRGIEGELAFHLANTATGHWDLRLYGDRVRATLVGGGNVPRIPAARLGSELVWDRGEWRATVGAVRYFAQDHIAAHETPTDGFSLVNLNLNWTFHDGMDSQWQVFAEAHNLTNQTARLATSLFKEHSPLPGRNIALGIRAWF